MLGAPCGAPARPSTPIPTPSIAASRAAAEALAATGAERASAALVFAVGPDVDLERVAAAACEALGTGTVASAAGHGVLAGSHEDETGPAVAVLALAGVDGLAFGVAGAGRRGRHRLGGRGRDSVARRPSRISSSSSPIRSAATRHGSRRHWRDLQPATVAGAGAALGAGGRPLLACADRPVRGGLCGLVLSLDAPARVAVSQGCRPITDPIVVTRVEGNWVLELDGKPALDVYREIAREPLAADLRLAAERRAGGVAAQRASPARRRRRLGRAPRRGILGPRVAPSRCPSRCASAPCCASRCATPISPARIWRSHSPRSALRRVPVCT